jgi:hypothetical protein
LLLNFPDVILPVSSPSISLIKFRTKIIGNTVQERHRLNNNHSHHVAWAPCMVKEFTSAVTCRIENKGLIGGEGWGGGGGGAADFTFMLSEVSGPQREHSSYVICMCGCTRVMTFQCALLVTSVL